MKIKKTLQHCFQLVTNVQEREKEVKADSQSIPCIRIFMTEND